MSGRIGRTLGPTFRNVFCLFLFTVALLQLSADVAAPSRARAEPGTAPTAQPLEVEILSPVDGAEITDKQITLQLIVRTVTGATIRLHPIVNGQPQREKDRGLVVSSERAQGTAPPLRTELLRSLVVPLPAADCTVAVQAESGSLVRVSKAVHLRQKSPERFAIKPKLYLLSLGVSSYRQRDLKLDYASKDAADFARVFSQQRGGLYEEVQVQLLLDEKATRDRILDGLQWLQRQTTVKDVAVLFLAGHGIEDPSSGVFYFLPHDADEGAVMRSMISQQSLQTALRSIPGKTILFLDTCHAASVMNESLGRAVTDVSRLVNELAAVENGLVVYAAATGRQLSQESPRWGNGAFTKAVVEGIEGRAAYHADRPVTLQMLNLYVSERVKELTGGRQTPIMVSGNKVADFPLAIARPRAPGQPPLESLPGDSGGIPNATAKTLQMLNLSDGTSTSVVAWDGAALWVADLHGKESRFIRIDPKSGAILSSLPVPPEITRSISFSMSGLAWNGSLIVSGDVLVNSDWIPTIYQVNPKTGALVSTTAVALPAKASSIRSYGMTWGADSVWLLCYGFLPPQMQMWIGRVAGNAFSEIHALPPGTKMHVGLAYVRGSLYSLGTLEQAIHRIRPADGIFDSSYPVDVPNPSHMMGGAHDGTGYWSIDIKTKTLYRLAVP